MLWLSHNWILCSRIQLKGPLEECFYLLKNYKVKILILMLYYSTQHKDIYTHYKCILGKKAHLIFLSECYIFFLFLFNMRTKWPYLLDSLTLCPSCQKQELNYITKTNCFKFLIHLAYASVNWFKIFFSITLIFILMMRYLKLSIQGGINLEKSPHSKSLLCNNAL